jgi:hypothetical protein
MSFVNIFLHNIVVGRWGGDSSFKAFSVSVTDRPKAASPAIATDTGNTQQQQLQPVVEQRPDGGK